MRQRCMMLRAHTYRLVQPAIELTCNSIVGFLGIVDDKLQMCLLAESQAQEKAPGKIGITSGLCSNRSTPSSVCPFCLPF